MRARRKNRTERQKLRRCRKSRNYAASLCRSDSPERGRTEWRRAPSLAKNRSLRREALLSPWFLDPNVGLDAFRRIRTLTHLDAAAHRACGGKHAVVKRFKIVAALRRTFPPRAQKKE